MTSLMLDRAREKPSWLLRALDRATPAATRDERLLSTHDVIAATKPPIQPPQLQRSRTTLKSKDGSSSNNRAGNPTPNAGLQKLQPVAPAAPIDPVLGDKKLAYLHQDTQGKVHLLRSNTTLGDQAGSSKLAALERLATFAEKERERWYAQEVRSAPDSTHYASRPWLRQQPRQQQVRLPYVPCTARCSTCCGCCLLTSCVLLLLLLLS